MNARLLLVLVALGFGIGAWAAEPVDPLVKAGELYEKGEWQEAAKLYRRVARTSTKGNAIAWFNYGNCLIQLGKRGEALNAWRKAIEWAPSFRRARLNVAILSEEDGDLGQAVAQYRKLWELDAKDPLVPARLGEILLTQKAPAEAELWFARALSIDTVSSAAYDGLVRAQLEQSDTLSARTTLGRWSESVRDTTGRAWFTLAGLWERAGALEPARRSVETGLAFQPANVEGWLRLARLAQLRGDDATAVAVLRQATERLPTEKRVWRSLGLAAMRGNDLVMAWEGLRTAYTLGDSDCVPSLRSLQAWHQTRGENAQADRIAHLLDGK